MEVYNQKDNSMISDKFFQLSASFLAIIFLWSCKSSKSISTLIDNATNKDTSQLILEVDFQKHFDKDTVSLSIEDDVVFNKIILISTDIVDFTRFTLYVVHIANGKVFAVYNGKRNDNGMDFYGKTQIGSIKNNLKLACTINGRESINYLDISDGKFVGISKIEKDSIAIRQRKASFQYD